MFDVAVTDRQTRKTLFRRLESAPTRRSKEAAAVLALHAVELIQASLLELRIEEPSPPALRAAQPPAPVPPELDRWLDASVADGARRGGPGLEAAVAGLHGLSGIGLAFGPMLRLSSAGEVLGGRLTWIGPAGGARVSALQGEAAVRQELGLAEITLSPAAGARLRPVLAAGAGVHHVHLQGSASAPFVGTTDDLWALALAVSAGLRLQTSARTALLLDAGAVFLLPRPIVEIAGRDAGSAGLPSLLVSLGFVLEL